MRACMHECLHAYVHVYMRVWCDCMHVNIPEKTTWTWTGGIGRMTLGGTVGYTCMLSSG